MIRDDANDIFIREKSKYLQKLLHVGIRQIYVELQNKSTKHEVSELVLPPHEGNLQLLGHRNLSWFPHNVSMVLICAVIVIKFDFSTNLPDQTNKGIIVSN